MPSFEPNTKHMLAVCTIGDGRVELRSVPIPSPAPGQVLIHVKAAAQNPTDWKTVMNYNKANCIVGCDFAGVVAELGHSVDPTQAHVGERVAGLVHGAVRANGAFAEYLVCPVYTLIKIPESWSFEQAAQLPVGCFTACQCLYQSQALPSPIRPLGKPLDILVWGGSSSVGHFTIQFAKMGGMRVITTTSPQNFDKLTALGADEVFDYKNPKSGQKIRAFTHGELRHAVDCISERATPFQVSESLSVEGGAVSVVNPYASRKKGVNTVLSLAYTVLGDAFEFPESYTPIPEHVEFAAKAGKLISQLLAEGKVTPVPIKVMPHGLASVIDGFDYMKAGKVSNEKIIYRISDTPGVLDLSRDQGLTVAN